MLFEIPVWAYLIVIVGLPVFVTIFFGMFAFKEAPLLDFRCLRCDRAFRKRAYKKFPSKCPHCGARDWNVGAGAAG
jgi:hypothetical protein